MIALAWKHENVYIDTSAHLPRYYPPQLLHFMRSYGRTKVLFGTNFPQLPFEKCMGRSRPWNCLMRRAIILCVKMPEGSLIYLREIGETLCVFELFGGCCC